MNRQNIVLGILIVLILALGGFAIFVTSKLQENSQKGTDTSVSGFGPGATKDLY